MDDLEADIRAAMAGDSAPAPAAVADAVIPATIPDTAPAPAAAEAPKTDDRPRDEHGKFAPKADAPKVEAKAADPKTAPVAAQPATPVAQALAAVAAQPITAPQNWKGAGKVQWDKLPEAVRNEIKEDYTRFADKEARLGRLDAAIGERAPILAAQYGTVEQGLQNLFAISDLATKNPQGFVLWFCQQRGLNLAQMVGQPQQPGEQPAQAPDPVMQELNALKTYVANMAQQQQQGALDPIIAEINRFASDPAHPYWNDVEAQVMANLKSGQVKGSSPSERLQNAYDMAIWAHPEIRTSLIDGQVQQRTTQQSQAAQQAINASVSVSGSPAGAKIASDEPDETLEQTLRRAQRAATGS